MSEAIGGNSGTIESGRTERDVHNDNVRMPRSSFA